MKGKQLSYLVFFGLSRFLDMAERKIEEIEDFVENGSDGTSPFEQIPTTPIPENQPVPKAEPLVSLHYPKPTPISEVVKEIAQWSSYHFVMDPQLNRSMQVFSPHKVTKSEAFLIFIASLETVGLRALQLEGAIVKIVPFAPSKIAV